MESGRTGDRIITQTAAVTSIRAFQERMSDAIRILLVEWRKKKKCCLTLIKFTLEQLRSSDNVADKPKTCNWSLTQSVVCVLALSEARRVGIQQCMRQRMHRLPQHYFLTFEYVLRQGICIS